MSKLHNRADSNPHPCSRCWSGRKENDAFLAREDRVYLSVKAALPPPAGAERNCSALLAPSGFLLHSSGFEFFRIRVKAPKIRSVLVLYKCIFGFCISVQAVIYYVYSVNLGDVWCLKPAIYMYICMSEIIIKYH